MANGFMDAVSGMGDFLTGTTGNQLLSGAGNYFLGREQIQDIEELGRQQQAALGQFGEQIAQQAEFRPFTVTTGLGTTTTTPTGGVAVGLSPEQQALQQQLLGQATGLFGQVGVSPAEAQADIYEQIRATQRPEEERQRLAMEERLLSQGRLGLQSAAYGGASPELLALETARQEAMARAGLSARQQALAEQQQALAGATGLLAAGYSPQQQALEALRIGAVPAGMAQAGQLGGAELQAQLGRSGIEANLAMQQLAAELRQQRDAGLMQSLMGRQPTLQEQLLARYVGMSPEEINQLGSGGLLSSLGDLLGFGGSGTSGVTLQPTFTPTNIGDMTTEQFLNTIIPPTYGTTPSLTLPSLSDLTPQQFVGGIATPSTGGGFSPSLLDIYPSLVDEED